MPKAKLILPRPLNAWLLLATPAQATAADFQRNIRPWLDEFCLECHSTTRRMAVDIPC